MPSKNQLFKINPDLNIIKLLLEIFGLDDFILLPFPAAKIIACVLAIDNLFYLENNYI